MNRKIVVVLSGILFNIIIISTAQTQLEGEVVGNIRKTKGEVFVGDKEAYNGMKLFIGNTIETKKESEVDFKLGRVDFTLGDSKVNSKVEIKGRFRTKLLAGTMRLSNVSGDIGNGTKATVVETTHGNCAGKGTSFVVTTQGAGTTVDVLDGQVEFIRNGEERAIDITRDCKMLLDSKDYSIIVISPESLYMVPPASYTRAYFLAQVGLSTFLPGIGRIYARRDTKKSVIIKLLSIGSLVGFFISDAKRENAEEVSTKAYYNYENEIQPDKIEAFYNRHQDNLHKAKINRNRQIVFGSLWFLMSFYETYSTIRDIRSYSSHQKIIERIKDLDKNLLGYKIDFEIKDEVVLSKVCWNF